MKEILISVLLQIIMIGPAINGRAELTGLASKFQPSCNIVFYYRSQLIDMAARLISGSFQNGRSTPLWGKLAKVYSYFPALFPYRFSAPDQQGQTVPLITQTADENESKMRPITTRPWLISFYRPLSTHTGLVHAYGTHTPKLHVYTHTPRCVWINNGTET